MPQTIDNMSVTWTNSLTTYTGIKLNAAGSSDANSAVGSLLMDLQVGGSSKFNIAKDGSVAFSTRGSFTPILLASGSSFEASLSGFSASRYTRLGYDAVLLPGIGLPGFSVVGQGAFSFSPSGSSLNVSDTLLTRRGVANFRFGATDTGAVSATVTITIAAPGVVTWSGHGFSTGTPVVFTTTGALPTGITAGTTYYAVVVDANTIQLAASVANAIAATPTVITTSGSQSGTHTGTRYNITQRLSIQGITGVADRLGADLIIQGSQGTGTGAGGSIVFQVAPAGSSGTAQNALATALTINSARQLLTITGTKSAPQLAVDGDPASGLYFGSAVFGYSSANYDVMRFNAGLRIYNGAFYGWTDGEANSSTVDLRLYRDAANTLALRNGANAQRFNLYGTYTNDTNYERMYISANSSFVDIGTQAAGSGTVKALRLFGSNASLIQLNTDGSIKIDASSGLDLNPSFIQMSEQTAPAAPAANKVRIYAEDDGAGKTRLMARFATGAAVQIAIEP